MFDLEHRTRPILKWAGGKARLLPQLVAHFPDRFDRYLEPFLGGGAVFLALRPGVPAVVGDSNPELINLYTVVRDRPQDLTRALDRLAARYSEEFYYRLREEEPRDAIRRAARTVFLNKTGYNGLYRQNSKGGFNVPFGWRERCPGLYNGKDLAAFGERLRAADLRCAAFERILGVAGPGDFAYCDPPYEPLSKSSSFTAYRNGGFSRADQERLHDACAAAAARGARVAVSNSSAPFILDLYRDFDIRTVMARRDINSRTDARGEIAEVLVLMDPARP
jgi:DNA adenine methylase